MSNIKSSLWQTLKRKCYTKTKGPKTFVSGSSVRNYLLKDPIIDWLQIYHDRKTNSGTSGTSCTSGNSGNSSSSGSSGNSSSIITDMGNKFEEKVYEYLKKKYPRDTIDLSNGLFDINESGNTLAAIKKGYPLIFQGTVYDRHTNIGGVTDIIILGSWLTKLFGIIPPSVDKYYVIDIKWSKINLCADGVHIRNSGRMPSYKGQLLIYTFALNSMQNTKECDIAYVLAKSYNICSKNKGNTITNCFKKLGVIDFTDRDNQYVNETRLAIEWLRNVRKNGRKWDVLSDDRLLPNMKNKYDGSYHKIKTDIAEKKCDVTLLWNVSVKNRDIGFKNGIRSYSQTGCSSELLGIKNGYSPIINNIIKINNDSTKDIINPKKLCGYLPIDCKDIVEFYIDFETVNSSFLENQKINIHDSKTETRIFMIGVGYYKNKKWIHSTFTMDKFGYKGENIVVDSFIKFIKNILSGNKKNKARFYYWSHIECTLIRKNSENRKNIYSEFIKEMEWIDLLDVFKSGAIVVKGAKNYSLKEIAKNMYDNGLIKTTWDNNKVSNGFDALTTAGRIYGGNLNCRGKKNLIDDVKKYNEVDCKVLWDIVRYMRDT